MFLYSHCPDSLSATRPSSKIINTGYKLHPRLRRSTSCNDIYKMTFILSLFLLGPMYRNRRIAVLFFTGGFIPHAGGWHSNI